jgi:hypothetical protein
MRGVARVAGRRVAALPLVHGVKYIRMPVVAQYETAMVSYCWISQRGYGIVVVGAREPTRTFTFPRFLL